MKHTRLMRKLSKGDKVFSTLLNKAFDEAIENGSASLVDDNNDLEIATVGNDIVVEDKDTEEVTKFSENPEDPNDMVMEPVIEEEVVNNRTIPMSRRRRAFSEELDEVPPVVNKKNPLDDTVPEIVVNVNEGVNDKNKSGTLPFSIRIKGATSPRMYSVVKAIKKAFSDEELPVNLSKEVEDIVNEKIEEVKNELKTESKRSSRAFSDDVENIINEKLEEVKNELKTELKTESRKNVKRWMKSFSESPEEVEVPELENIVNKENDPEIEPKVNLEEKTESRGFSNSKRSSISSFLNCKFN